jgi:hypothetical protein
MTNAWEAHLWDCAWCDTTFNTDPIRTAYEYSWLIDPAYAYCSMRCRDAHDKYRIEAAARVRRS